MTKAETWQLDNPLSLVKRIIPLFFNYVYLLTSLSIFYFLSYISKDIKIYVYVKYISYLHILSFYRIKTTTGTVFYLLPTIRFMYFVQSSGRNENGIA